MAITAQAITCEGNRFGNEVEEEWVRVLKQAVTYNPVYEP